MPSTSCPVCGVRVEWKPAVAGQVGKCPNCSEPLQYGRKGASENVAAERPPAGRRPPAVARPLPRPTGAPRFLLLVGAFGLGVAIMALAWLLVSAAGQRTATNSMAVATASQAPPIEDLERLLDRVRREGTSERVVFWPAPLSKWFKSKSLARGLRYELQSGARPAALATWESEEYMSRNCETKEEAEAAPASQAAAFTFRYWAEFEFRDGRWALKDLGRGRHDPGDDRHSTLKEPLDPIVDWWQAFGGE